MEGQWWRCKKLRREAGGTVFFGSFALGDVFKKEVMDFWRKGAIPLMFQEKMRMVCGSGGEGRGDGDARMFDGAVRLNFRRLEGGGLIERSIADGKSPRSWCFECEVRTWFCDDVTTPEDRRM
jgi:hypothetical protein